MSMCGPTRSITSIEVTDLGIAAWALSEEKSPEIRMVKGGLMDQNADIEKWLLRLKSSDVEVRKEAARRLAKL